MKYYTGIGSPEASQEIKNLVYRLAYRLAKEGYILRSGGDKGTDNAFELGAKKARGEVEIYLPWNMFYGKMRDDKEYFVPSYFDNYKRAISLARRFYPDYGELEDWDRKLIARYGYLVFGKKLKGPSRFIICWTPDSCATTDQITERTGNTAQAIALARHNNIPIFNINIIPHQERIENWLENKLSS